MENTEEVFQCLDEFVKRKPKIIPRELEDYLSYVARTGDPVYQWALVKYLFKEKLLNVITDFYETSPGLDIPHCPNVDPFNYDAMKNSLLERLDSFASAPFTVQRLCELLTAPRKQYNRIDKFMRAIEKNVLVVSTREPGAQRHNEPENGEQMESMVNGSDNTSDYNVDVEMEDMSWKENTEHSISQPQPSSSDGHISIDDIEARLQAKQESSMDVQEKVTKEYESVTPPELNVSTEESTIEKPVEEALPIPEVSSIEINKEKIETESDTKNAIETESQPITMPLNVPEILVEDAEMTEKSLRSKSPIENKQPSEVVQPTELNEDSNHSETKEDVTNEPVSTLPENNTEREMRETEPNEPKLFSEVSTSSEESSSSSDNTDGNSNSPKPDSANHIDIQEETSQEEISQPDNVIEPCSQLDEVVMSDLNKMTTTPETSDDDSLEKTTLPIMQTDDYSISDVQSELPQVSSEDSKSPENPMSPENIKSAEDSEPLQELKLPEDSKSLKNPKSPEDPKSPGDSKLKEDIKSSEIIQELGEKKDTHPESQGKEIETNLDISDPQPGIEEP